MAKEVIQDQILLYHPRKSFTVISKGRVVNILFEEITHASKYGNETMIYTVSTHYKTSNNLREILNELPVNDFFRIHRSHIVALKFMNGVKRNRIVVGDFFLPVTKYYKVPLLARFAEIINRNIFFTNKTLTAHESSV